MITAFSFITLSLLQFTLTAIMLSLLSALDFFQHADGGYFCRDDVLSQPVGGIFARDCRLPRYELFTMITPRRSLQSFFKRSDASMVAISTLYTAGLRCLLPMRHARTPPTHAAGDVAHFHFSSPSIYRSAIFRKLLSPARRATAGTITHSLQRRRRPSARRKRIVLDGPSRRAFFT